MVLNRFCALAHFEKPQILVAQFIAVANLFHEPSPTLTGTHIFVAHFDYVGDVMTTKLLGSASKLMAAEVISKGKKKFIPVPRMASTRAELELICKGKQSQCAFYSWVLIRMAVHMQRYFLTSFDLQTHY